MPNKTLTAEQARSLLVTHLASGSQYVPAWPSEEDCKRLYKAAKSKKKKVEFTDGRTYSIQYDKKQSIAWGEYDVVYVKPTTGPTIPCGWLHVDFLLTRRGENNR